VEISADFVATGEGDWAPATQHDVSHEISSRRPSRVRLADSELKPFTIAIEPIQNRDCVRRRYTQNAKRIQSHILLPLPSTICDDLVQLVAVNFFFSAAGPVYLDHFDRVGVAGKEGE